MTTGFIYKVTNKVNGKVYIGQTRRSVEFRWNQHKKSKDCYDFHKAIQEFGPDNFTVETIEQCPVEDLDSREIYWISKYNSFRDGYNMTKGGYPYNPSKRYNNGYIVVDSKYDEIAGMWLSGFSATKIASLYQVDRHVICNILKQLGFKINYNKISLNTIETKELLDKYNSGYSIRSISKEYGYSAPAIKDFLIKKGANIKNRSLIIDNVEDQKRLIDDYINRTLPLKDILKKYKCQYKTFEKILKAYGIEKIGKGRNYKLEDKDCLDIIKLFNEGKRVTEIATSYKVDKCTIYSVLKRYHVDYLKYNNPTSTQTLSEG
jgi:group I intron endonuclease